MLAVLQGEAARLVNEYKTSGLGLTVVERKLPNGTLIWTTKNLGPVLLLTGIGSSRLAGEVRVDDWLVLYGPSGCGKTRTSLENVCRERGLYFTLQEGLDRAERTHDMLHFCDLLQDGSVSRHGVRDLFHALICSRLLVLNQFKFPDTDQGRTDWVFIQLFSQNGLFKDMFKFFLKHGHSSLLSRVTADRLLRTSENRQFAYGSYRGEKSQLRVFPVTYAIVKAVTSPIKLILSGTGFKLSNMDHLRSVGVEGADRMLPTRHVFCDFGAFTEEKQMKEYCDLFGVGFESQAEQSRMFSMLRGRYRILSNYIFLCLRGTDKELIPEKVVGTFDFLPYVEALCHSEHQALFTALKTMLRKYVLSNQFILPFESDKNEAEFVDQGICRLARSEDENLAIRLDEPIIVRGLSASLSKLGLTLQSLVFSKLLTDQPNASSMGFAFEEFAPLIILRLFGAPIKLQDALQGFAKDDVKEMLDEEVRLEGLELWKDEGRMACQAVDALTFLMDREAGVSLPFACFPKAQDATADCISTLIDKNHKRYLLLVQCKFVKDAPSDPWRTTDMKNWYPNSPHKKSRVDEFLRSQERNYIRIAFTFPPAVGVPVQGVRSSPRNQRATNSNVMHVVMSGKRLDALLQQHKIQSSRLRAIKEVGLSDLY